MVGTNETDPLIAQIVENTEAAIELAGERLDQKPVDWRGECYRNLASQLASYKASLLAGRLPAPGLGVGWGAGKALSEWGLDDIEMSRAVEAAEGLYRMGR